MQRSHPSLRLLVAAATLLATTIANAAGPVPTPSNKPYGLVIHGGAGVIVPGKMTPETERALRDKLEEALNAGYAVLDQGGLALDAVSATITILEDSPLFNAGKGAVLNSEGVCELDAAIMDGRTLAAGAVGAVQHIRNPLTLARTVMEKSRYVMMVGEGAERFAVGQGFELVPNEYFQTGERIKELEEAKKKADHGTVGAVALDRHGNLAAGTSTGGRTNKHAGRIGDSPIIGAGTYANNATVAVSATGTGEYFIRQVAGYDISAQIEYLGKPVSQAAENTLAKITKVGGDGGLIAIDRNAHIAMPFNTPGMYRGFKLSNGRAGVALYGDAPARP